jgi:glycosyltransferase involved in cell wall biosynthesis
MKFDSKDISIIICARNEGEGIERIIRSAQPYGEEILVVDGHSNDGTKEIAERLGARFFLDNKKGRGDAVKVGVAKATKSILVFYDADGSHEETDIPALVEPIRRDEADLVIGSRIKGGCLDASLSTLGDICRLAGTNFMVYLVNQRFNVHLTELLYSFRAIRTKTARDLKFQANNFAIEQDMVVRALKAGTQLAEVPSREKARGWGESKLKTSMGINLLYVLVRDLFFVR